MARRQAALAKAGDLATLETLIAVYCIYERSQKFDKRCLFSANYKSMPYRQNKYANVIIITYIIIIMLNIFYLPFFLHSNQCKKGEEKSLR